MAEEENRDTVLAALSMEWNRLNPATYPEIAAERLLRAADPHLERMYFEQFAERLGPKLKAIADWKEDLDIDDGGKGELQELIREAQAALDQEGESSG